MFAMKNVFIRTTLTAAAALLAASLLLPAHAQVDKVKGKAKDLKKDVENGKAPTNKPPQAPKPAK